MKHIALSLSVAVLISACATSTSVVKKSAPDMFMDNLAALCGKSFAGKVISNDEVDADWRAEELVIYVRDCDEKAIKIPLHVGENRSRTWIVSRTTNGLKLQHDHRHEDGEPDSVTLYGGDTLSPGTATQQAFPADTYSKDLFMREFLTESVNNTWTLTLEPGKTLTYALSRPGRDFRAKFDLTNPVKTPPPVWGYEAESAPS